MPERPLLTVVIACLINIAGDLLLVAGFHMGAAGAATATVLAQAVSVIISMAMICRRTLPFAFQRGDIHFDRQLIGKELKLGIPVGLQEFLVGASFLVIQTVVNSFGVTASAGVGVAEKVCVFIMLVPSAYMQSMSAFVAQNMGAGNPKRADRATVMRCFYGFLCGPYHVRVDLFPWGSHGGPVLVRCGGYCGSPQLLKGLRH